MRRWGGIGLLLSVLGWPMLLYGATFETQHMGVIVGSMAPSGSEPAEAMPAEVTPTSSPSSGLSVSGGATFINSLGMVFVLIHAGEFMMGSNDGDYDERPVHQVRISKPFYLGKYEVTQGQW